MTIKLNASYGKYKANDIVSLDAVTEAALIAAGQATATLTGGVPYVDINADDIPANLTTQEIAALRSSVSGGTSTAAVNPWARGSKGRLLTNWPSITASAGTAVRMTTDLPPDVALDGATGIVSLQYNAGANSNAQAAVISSPAVPVRSSSALFPAIGIWVKNPTSRPLDFGARCFNVAADKSFLLGGSARPAAEVLASFPDSGGWEYLVISPRSVLAGAWVIGADQASIVRVEALSATAVGGVPSPNGVWQAGDELRFGPVYLDPFRRPAIMLGFDDVPKNVYRPAAMSGTAPASGRSGFDILSYYGLKGTVFLSKAVFNSSTNGATLADIQALKRGGWSIGSHSATHPVDANAAGLRLLGPYGYNRSLLSGNGFANCRVTAATASNDTLTTEAAHKLSTNTLLTFPVVAPTGLSVGVTYWVFSAVGTTFKLATSAGNAAGGIAVDIPADWTGVAEFRYPGSAPDDSAIYADIIEGRNYLTSLGLTGHEYIFALPQGGWDHYVRTAVQRAGMKLTRSTSANLVRMIGSGRASGGTVTAANPYWACGWPEFPDGIGTENGSNLAQCQGYIDELIALGAVGANYHHESNVSADVLDGLCSYIATKKAAGLIDDITADDWIRGQGY